MTGAALLAGTVLLVLTSTVHAAPSVVVDPTYVDFGEVPVHVSPRTLPFSMMRAFAFSAA